MKMTFRLMEILAMTTCTALAQSTWVGDTAIDDNWGNAANWKGVPVTGNQNLTIQTGTSTDKPIIFNQPGTMLSFKASTFASTEGSEGHLVIRAGTIEFASGSTTIGGAGNGSIVIGNGGVLRKMNGSFGLGSAAQGHGVVTVQPGGLLEFTNQNSVATIGNLGRGIINVHGGAMKIVGGQRINVGTAAEGTGTIDIRGGLITAHDASSLQQIRIGFISFQPNSGSGNGCVSGYGTIDMRSSGGTGVGGFLLGGSVTGDGMSIDGIVHDATLDIRALRTDVNESGIAVANNIPGTTHFGWYTRNQGAVRLTPIVSAVSASDLYWGCDNITGAAKWTVGAASTVPVNSAYLRRSTPTNSVTLQISLLDPTRTTTAGELAPLPRNTTSQRFLNIWQIDATSGVLSIDRFYQRYDEGWNTVNTPGRGSALLGFLRWDEAAQQWIDLTAHTTIDTQNYLVNLNVAAPLVIAEGESAFIALAASIPGTLFFFK